jgi:protein TonB
MPLNAADEMPTLLAGLQPRYPESLRSTGLVGTVELEYVISSLGRVELGSIRVLRSTHQAFSEAAREALTTARFTPARRGGRPVAVLVRQTVRFVVSFSDAATGSGDAVVPGRYSTTGSRLLAKIQAAGNIAEPV